MNLPRELRRRGGMLAASIAALWPALAVAQLSPSEPASGAWRYGISLNGYLPTLSGTSSTPADSNGTPIGINAENIMDNLKFTAMGTFEAHNGQWGVFTDLIYLHLGDSKQQTREFTLGGAAPAAGATADLEWNFRGTIWTLGGQYRVVTDPTVRIDALAGARWFDVRTSTRWSISGNLGPIQPSGRTGSVENEVSALDGIVGVKGRMALEPSGRWSLPFYLDVGAGESDLTWQAAAGVTYAFQWGELSAVWRFLAYELKSGQSLTDLKLNGPMIGATWRW
jgi:hypothetical protein